METTPFNQLTPAEAERLDWLQEECAEVIKAISKIKRHGYASFNPDDPNHKGNRHDLQVEIRDVFKAVALLEAEEDINLSGPCDPKVKFMHHQTIQYINTGFSYSALNLDDEGNVV